ncbi:MAG: response regulator transcription factor [Magnetococcales bacterium]|nr:response regulator transcription factor [Magnetococcales bacterium]MBF0436841.1 response regulator transcription factor [Magnetococcales bacterium]
MQNLLLVDDDKEFCRVLSQFLEGEGFQCEMVHDGVSALHTVAQRKYDALIVDVMMPKMNGFEVVRRLRKTCATPVLMLTARGDENDSIVGLEIGADDYLAKPCNPKVLSAHLRAVLRRADGNTRVVAIPVADTMIVGDITIHPGSRQVKIGSQEIDITNTEYKILELMVRTPGQVVDKETLSLKGLNRKLNPYDRSIDFHISSLRRKLGPGPGNAQRIITIRNEGYLYTLPLTK